MSADETTTPNVAEQIRSWLPDHTHVDEPSGLFNMSPRTTWTWSTRRGVWAVTWLRGLTGPGFRLEGPGAEVHFGGLAEVALRQLFGVLVALDAIDGEVAR